MAEFTLIFIRQQRSWDETLKNAINILNKTRKKVGLESGYFAERVGFSRSLTSPIYRIFQSFVPRALLADEYQRKLGHAE